MSELIDMLALYRSIWIAGRPRGGKTSLSIALALAMCADGYADKIAINTPLNVGTLQSTLSIAEVQQLENVVTIIDEAWLQLGTWSKPRDRDAWLAYRGKLNQYHIMPSARDLHSSLRDFVIERTMNWMPFGIPLWQYHYNLPTSKVKRSKKVSKAAADVGKYNWWHPSRVFPYYAHKLQPKEHYFVYTF